MGALEHSSNVIWHTASTQCLGAKILCTLLNVHKLVSLLRITPTGKSCWWWGFSYCLQTTLTSYSFTHSLTCLCTCSCAHLWHTPLSVWQLPVHMYVYLCVCVWCRVIMALWVSCHWQTSCISWIVNELVSSKLFLQNRFKDKYSETMHGRWKQLPFLPRFYTLCGWHCWSDALLLSMRRSQCLSFY